MSMNSLMLKTTNEKLTRDELACALYEGTQHLQNLAEKLARQHGDGTEALTFYDMMWPEVQNFWKLIADQLIEHASAWGPNEGSGCCMKPGEHEKLKALPRAKEILS